jgi:hypothetical protein
VEPELRVIKEVERGERHALVLQGVADKEVPLTMFQPWEGVAGAVELRELQFVGGREEGPVTGGRPGWPVPGCAVWLRRAQWQCATPGVALLLPLDVVYCRVECLLLLALRGDHPLE